MLDACFAVLSKDLLFWEPKKVISYNSVILLKKLELHLAEKKSQLKVLPLVTLTLRGLGRLADVEQSQRQDAPAASQQDQGSCNVP